MKRTLPFLHLTLPLSLVCAAGVVAPAVRADPGPVAVAPAAAPAAPPAAPKAKPTAADAKAFVEATNAELLKLSVDAARTDWVKSTYITDDTDLLSAQAGEKLMNAQAAAIKAAAQFNGVDVDPATARALMLLKVVPDLPAPSDAKKGTELADIASKLSSMYGKGKACRKGKDGKEECRDLEALNDVFRDSKDADALLDAWTGWHKTAQPMRPLYARYVDLANEGARDLGFKNVADLWKSRYDMAPDAFEGDVDRLWTQMQPLYQDLHCYVRGKLADHYKGKMKNEGPIPAHLLGNMWAQEWSAVDDLVEPYAGQTSLDVTAALEAKKKTELDMVKIGEGFYTSMGLKPLPKTFYERSLFLKPADRDVVCHASAWDVTYANDVRIKMCIKRDEDNLTTIHHELGHIYYYQYYYKLPFLFQQGANDGFHEAIGDAIALAITPEYLKKIGLFDNVAANDKLLINEQMKQALDKVAFLPFGLMMDKWRWDVFSGKTKPADYNKHWWELRRKYQGVMEPVARTEADFDPGAKYHIPANVPYARYFLARIYQFQFYKAMCDASGYKGPLNACSFYGSKPAGDRLKAMLELGASKPWTEAMKVMTGQSKIDAAPMVEYFQPLSAWLKEQNKGKTCGW